MGRAWRIEYEGAFYHLMSRGNNGQDIYFTDDDRRLFLETLSEMSERFDIEIYAYVLMSNHYHLLVRTLRANLKKAMQWFGTTYTRRFNNQNARSGHLFQGRYKSILVQDDAYMMQLSCYIHRNPLRAGIVRRLIDYRWSSYPVYAYGRKRPAWLSTQRILSYFKAPEKHRQYRIKVQKYAGEEDRLLENFRHGLIFGTKEFVNDINKRFLPDMPFKDLPQQRKLAKAKDKKIQPEELISKVAKVLQIDLNRYIHSKRLRGIDKMNRDLIVYLLWNNGLETNTEIGDRFNMTSSAVSHSVKAFKKEMNRNRQAQKLFERFNS